MTMNLDGVVAVVTGASSGIGASVARALAGAGATVALLARRRDRLDQIVRDVNTSGCGRAVAVEVDLAEPDAAAEAIARLASACGSVDVLVNCAGYGTFAAARRADLADWQRMVQLNLSAVLACTHAALPHLCRAAEGVRGVADVVSISSIAGRTIPGSSTNVYAATKHAVGAFSEALRQELAPHHVRVGLVEPGVVATEATTGGRTSAPDAATVPALDAADVADAVLWMITRPRQTAINEILVRPTEQRI